MKNNHTYSAPLFPVFLSLIIYLALYMVACRPANKGPVSHIVVLHSLAPDEPYYPDFNRNIAQQLEEHGVNAELKYFYLNCELLDAQQEEAYMRTFLDSIRDWKPDLILANEDQATYTLLNCNHPLARQIPIVFCGVNFPNQPLMEKYTNLTGYIDVPDYQTNIRLIEKILGKVRIIVNYDETFLGQQAFHIFMDQVKDENLIFNYNRLSKVFPHKFDTLYNEHFTSFHFSPHMPRPDTMMIDFIPFRQIRGMEVFGQLSGIERYYTYLNIKHDYMTIPLGRYFEVPTFTSVVEGFGYSNAYAGGYFTSYEIQSQEGAELAARILNDGVAPADIPIRESKKEYVFDWDEMQRFNIDPKFIPSQARIVDMPFQEQHKTFFLILEILIALLIVSIISYLLFLYTREASRKRMALSKLKQERESLALAIEGGNTFVWKYENDTFIFDEDFFNSLDMDPQILTPDEFIYMVHPEDRKRFIEKITHFRAHQFVRRSAQFRCNFNGEGYQWWEFRYGQINTSQHPDDFQLSGLCLNIQRNKENEEALITARKKAEESDQMKSAFLANMSHEIRTPLNAIVGFSNLITSGEMELTQKEKDEFLNLINTNCDLLLKLINDILDLSRIESGRMDFIFAPCNLTELVKDIYHTHQLLMPLGVELKIEVPDKPVVMKTDRHRLTQVLTNFINNASKFTHEGYIKIGYYISDRPQLVHIYVEDTGKGIPKEKQKAIFERFNKLDEFAQGTGLGLAICKVIAQRFKGDITLWSEEGKGSRFAVVIPLYLPEPLPDNSSQPSNTNTLC